MLRDVAPIPLVLWVSAAALVHVAGGKATGEVATMMDERHDILAFARTVRHGVSPGGGLGTVEAELLPVDPKEEASLTAKAPTDGDFEAAPPVASAEPPRAPTPLAKPEPEPPKPAAPEPVAKAEPAKVEEKVPVDAALAKLEPVELKSDPRIAVVQDVQKDQPDNPNAARIADDANTTQREMMAALRAYNGAPKMEVGQTEPGPKDPGSGDVTERGFVEASQEPGPPRGGSVAARSEAGRPQPLGGTPPRSGPGGGQVGQQATPGSVAMEAGGGPSAADGYTAPGGGWSLDPSGGAGNGQAAQPGAEARPAMPGVPGVPGLPGFGQGGPYNLDYGSFMAATGGPEKLQEEVQKAHDARLAKHAGSMITGTDFQRYRAAIENYDPSVELGNQTSLNAARVPFATYINQIHNQIHPIFADQFLASLDKLPAGDRLAQKDLVTHLEIVLSQKDGHIVRLGITKPSGVTAFEVAALKSVESAAPFGKAPEIIASPDGLVYLHWEFYREPYYACTSKFAHPYILKNPPKNRKGGVPSLEPPAGPAPADDRREPSAPGPILPLKD
ncbi:MAG: TonB C-terminal domain-containing protein [Polyangiaceae bacterium]|nr:TonB C-terminal domain-containing protein [Polyangiaceae bacterium]